jgi:hypothetical protein
MRIKATVLRIVFFLLCLAGVSGVAQPQRPSNLQFDMFVGFNGTVPEAAWFPVVFEVKNDGPTFTGLIELEAEAYGGGPARSVTVELPTGSLKRLVIPAFAGSRYGGNWSARLLDERGNVRAQANSPPSQQTFSVNWKTRMVGALARTPRGAPTFPPIRPRQGDLQPNCAFIQPAIFPDNPIVLERLNAIYLNSEKAVELKESQVRALMAWLHAGGHLIVGVEQVSDVNGSPWLRGVFPCELTGNRTLAKHADLQEWVKGPMLSPDDRLFGDTSSYQPYSPRGPRAPGATASRTSRPVLTATNVFDDLAADPTFEMAEMAVATCKLNEGAVVMIGDEDAPLVVTGEQDRGRVTALLFSPEREPARSWKHLPAFWARLVEVPAVLYTSADVRNRWEPSSDGIFGAMVDSRQVRKMPVGWLLLLLVVYLGVIGPFDRWWLKKINRPMLTWITFPCYVVLFSLLIYFIGYKLRAGDTEWNEVHVVDVFPKGEQAELRGRTYASIYSPANQRYRLSSQARVATLRAEHVGGSSAQDKGGTRIAQQGDAFNAEVFVPVWVSQLYVNDWWQAAALPIGLSVTSQSGDSLQVTVDNHLDRPLKNTRFVFAERMLDVGEVPAGQKKTLTLRLTQGQALTDFVWQNGMNFQNVVQQRQSAFGGYTSGRIDDSPTASMAASFISELAGQQGNITFLTPPGLDLTPLVERGQAVLLAWTPDYTPTKPLNQFKPLRTHRDTLWRVACTVQK